MQKKRIKSKHRPIDDTHSSTAISCWQRVAARLTIFWGEHLYAYVVLLQARSHEQRFICAKPFICTNIAIHKILFFEMFKAKFWMHGQRLPSFTFLSDKIYPSLPSFFCLGLHIIRIRNSVQWNSLHKFVVLQQPKTTHLCGIFTPRKPNTKGLILRKIFAFLILL